MAVKNNNKNNKKVNILICSIAVVLIVSVIISVVSISNSRKLPPQLYNFDKDIAVGIDVSEHNKEIDWDKLKSQIDFVFIRVGYRGYGNGKIAEDKNAKENMKNAKKAGIPFGVYFYSQAVSVKEAKEEAEFTMDMIKKFDVSLPVIIDFEYAVDGDGHHTGRLAEANLTAEQNTDIINSFCEKAADKGYTAGVYASSSVLYREIDTDDLDDNTVIWAADYNDKVTFDVEYSIWQYSRTGTLDGIGSKYVDLNYWYKK